MPILPVLRPMSPPFQSALTLPGLTLGACPHGKVGGCPLCMGAGGGGGAGKPKEVPFSTPETYGRWLAFLAAKQLAQDAKRTAQNQQENRALQASLAALRSLLAPALRSILNAVLPKALLGANPVKGIAETLLKPVRSISTVITKAMVVVQAVLQQTLAQLKSVVEQLTSMLESQLKTLRENIANQLEALESWLFQLQIVGTLQRLEESLLQVPHKFKKRLRGWFGFFFEPDDSEDNAKPEQSTLI